VFCNGEFITFAYFFAGIHALYTAKGFFYCKPFSISGAVLLAFTINRI